jgi:hypothetical protein
LEDALDHAAHPAVVRALQQTLAPARRHGWWWNDRWISIEGLTAWFVAAGDETVEEDDGIRTIPYCLTGVTVRTTAGWRLRLLHGSEDWHPR